MSQVVVSDNVTLFLVRIMEAGGKDLDGDAQGVASSTVTVIGKKASGCWTTRGLMAEKSGTLSIFAE